MKGLSPITDAELHLITREAALAIEVAREQLQIALDKVCAAQLVTRDAALAIEVAREQLQLALDKVRAAQSALRLVYALQPSCIEVGRRLVLLQRAEAVLKKEFKCL